MTLATLTRYRGDTYPLSRSLVVDNTIFNLTGATAVVMSLSTQRSSGTILGPVAGVIVSATSGIATFDISALNLAVGEYYYDVQVTNASGITTTEVGKLIIDQDLSV